METKYLYIVFSSTPYFIGKAIRRITGEVYNHVSLALDAELSQMYGFARRYYRTPLYGGFVREFLDRYHLNGQKAHVSICKLALTQSQYQQVSDTLTQMYQNKDQYIYNHLSALGALFHKPVKAKDAYTCVEFCVRVLGTVGVGVTPGKYYSVGDLYKLLQPHVQYTGQIPDATATDPLFFAKKPVPYPTLTTLRELLKILPRLGK